MKRITLLITCLCTAAALAALDVLTDHFPGLFSSMLTFPFEQIGLGLGLLSKAGAVGNGAAVALWVGISAIPALAALRYGRGRETVPERISLFVLSATLLTALYGMANPRLLYTPLAEDLGEYSTVVKAVLGVAVWAVIVLYVTLRLIRLFRLGNRERLLRYMRTVLYVLCVFFTGAAAILVTGGIMALTDSSASAADTGFGAFRLAVELIPYIFDVFIIARVMDLMDIAGDEDRGGIVESAGRVSNICCLALGVTTGLTAVSDLVQIALMRRLSNVSVTADIPVTSIAFTVMILLLSRLLIENKELRDDNDLFI